MAPPKDRHFLALCMIRHYSSGGWYTAGYQWQEVYWGPKMDKTGDEFRLWTGGKSFTTETPRFTEWAELPERTHKCQEVNAPKSFFS